MSKREFFAAEIAQHARMKTLLLNPPSFENFDGGAGARYPARRETRSFWYPTWLAYPAGLIPRSRLLDAPSHGIGPEEVVRISSDYDFVAIFSSTAGLASDLLLAERIKAGRPEIRLALVGPHVTVLPEETLQASASIDLVVRQEFDYPLAEYASGREPEKIPGISFRKDGRIHHNPDRPPLDDLDGLPFAVEIYQRDLDFRRYNIPFLQYPYISFYTSRGCPSKCIFCLWPQTMAGHRWRTRSTDNVMREVRLSRELFPDVREIVFDDDTFTVSKPRVLELCRKLKPLKITWSCNSRVTADFETLKAMKDSGCRLLVVGFESGDPAILKNIKKGATVEQGLAFMKDCRRSGLKVHGDFQMGLPGETGETIERTMRFAEQLDPETIQVSLSHPYPGTELYEYLKKEGYLTSSAMTDEQGHQIPAFQYPGLTREAILKAVEDFYARYYFRPRIIFRIVGRALFSATDRRRLYQEGKEFFHLRSKRKEYLDSCPR